MKKKTLLIAVAAIVLAAIAATSTTLAWLSDQSSSVTNTFAVGEIQIELAETTEKYKIIPGATDLKDPTVTVLSGSEKCYVYVLVENNLVIGDDVVGIPDIDATKWSIVQTSGTKTLYRYNEVVDALNANQTIPVFTSVKYDGDKITSDNIGSLKDKTIVITAFAHQSEHLTNVDTPDNAAKEWAAKIATAG